ncbi:hypothetical protein [Streptomyces sp. DH8]|uniref:hypothetical protein n=1 Tax=Streptomyces sp. DH8 TaxID=2857008 RepID=UPI001E4FCA60|nr:hypothetical protein [Streptomyces sp. DH8]
MAIESFIPHPAPNDLMPLQAISDLLGRTGHPASVSTIRRWIAAEDLPTVRRRSAGGWRRDYVSYSDVLPVHRDWVLARDANEP